MGKYQKHCLDFARKYTGWHSYDKNCTTTKRVIKSLESKKLIATNEFYQFKAI